MAASNPPAAAPVADDERPLNIGVMTSGGDSAGMNAAVRAVVKMAIYSKCRAFVIREGWEGLVRGNSPPPSPQLQPTPPTTHAKDEAFSSSSSSSSAAPVPATLPHPSSSLSTSPKPAQDAFVPTYGEGELLREGVSEAEEVGLKGKYIIRVGWDDVRGWMDQGGTLIGTARCAAFRERAGRLRAAHNLIKEGIDALAVCGGDGSLTGADRLRDEWASLVAELLQNGDITQEQAHTHAHLRIVGLVGSIDNDLATTDLTIGASTALARICEAIDSISSTAASHSRAFVVEVMGRHCGWLALTAGIATGADYVFVPEHPPAQLDWRVELKEVAQAHRKLGKRKTIVIVAEGAISRDLSPIKPDAIKDVLANDLGLDTRVTTLGHVQRGGKPDANDRILATRQGVEAVKALREATPTTPSYVIGLRENKIERVELQYAVKMTQRVAAAIEEKEFEEAVGLRDAEFAEGLKAFEFISRIDSSKRIQEEGKRLRMAIMHIGAPAGGMNAATRTAVRYCLARGHTPLVIHNGFPGLLEDNIAPINWLRVDNWTTRGGSELGTNRVLPGGKGAKDLKKVEDKLKEHGVQGLLLIGGFEAFVAVKILGENRKEYPGFRIPIVAIPATISNNVPLNEFSLGSDTSLNALVQACDAIKQSASASRNRVFVVETQGGQCGYIAVMGALAAGAVLVYTPEEGMDMGRLGSDVEFLKRRFGLDVKGKSEGRLVIRSENASKVFTTEVITNIFKQEGAPLFDARSASLGHTLQGGVPTPLDRARATRLALRCCEFIESAAAARSSSSNPLSSSEGADDDDDAVIITIRGNSISFTSAQEMAAEADMEKRRGTNAWWAPLKGLAEVLGGRTGLGGGKGTWITTDA
ncbi:6-phosphofructokinase, alpha subunit [Tilletia horrida]|uniref:ATP-dependent 6-phosphofructokinase n=1 Tax=Tilletia horrida TaxID=155126 RepID=A0AAN6GM63_9BASI|nr:6-phosphofructokinase, alpha subunit [Tilletia horrida]KAK0563178.1 6-phosphofructokinase, alpha subunit [Tilletia horrida]